MTILHSEIYALPLCRHTVSQSKCPTMSNLYRFLQSSHLMRGPSISKYLIGLSFRTQMKVDCFGAVLIIALWLNTKFSSVRISPIVIFEDFGKIVLQICCTHPSHTQNTIGVACLPLTRTITHVCSSSQLYV